MHISQLAPTRVEKVEDVVKLGDEVMVKVMEIDGQGRINLSRKALLAGGAAGGVSGAPSGNGDFVSRGPRPPRERDAAPSAAAPGAPPTRRRRRTPGRRDDE